MFLTLKEAPLKEFLFNFRLFPNTRFANFSKKISKKLIISNFFGLLEHFRLSSIHVKNILSIYSIYEYNIPFNKHLKKILRSGFLQMRAKWRN